LGSSKNTVYFALITSFVALILSTLISNLYAQNTLNEEQIKEVEKDPVSIVDGCGYRVGLKSDPGKLCDSFSTYLHDKCERLDNLPEYCGVVAVYYPKRIAQQECMSNIPLPNDTLGIKSCIDYIIFNSTYSNLPLKLTLKQISFHSDYVIFDAIFSVYNPNPLAKQLVSISYVAAKQGNEIASGTIGEDYIEPLATKDFTIPGGQISTSEWNSMQIDTPYQVNGTFRYNSSSGIETKAFNFTS
jgi:hypothetical protein